MNNVKFRSLWAEAARNRDQVQSEDKADVYFITYGSQAATLLGVGPHSPTWNHPQLRVVTNDDLGALPDYLCSLFSEQAWPPPQVTAAWRVNYHMSLILLHGEVIVYDNGAGEPIGGAATWWWLDPRGWLE